MSSNHKVQCRKPSPQILAMEWFGLALAWLMARYMPPPRMILLEPWSAVITGPRHHSGRKYTYCRLQICTFHSCDDKSKFSKSTLSPIYNPKFWNEEEHESSILVLASLLASLHEERKKTVLWLLLLLSRLSSSRSLSNSTQKPYSTPEDKRCLREAGSGGNSWGGWSEVEEDEMEERTTTNLFNNSIPLLPPPPPLRLQQHTPCGINVVYFYYSH